MKITLTLLILIAVLMTSGCSTENGAITLSGSIKFDLPNTQTHTNKDVHISRNSYLADAETALAQAQAGKGNFYASK